MSIIIDGGPKVKRVDDLDRDKLAVGIGKTYTSLSKIMAEKSNCEDGDYLMILCGKNGDGKTCRLFYRVIKPQYRERELSDIANIIGYMPQLGRIRRIKKGKNSFRIETKYIYDQIGIKVDSMEWILVTIDTDRRLPDKIFYATGDITRLVKIGKTS